jgi:preprotein translocase subunit SecG
MYTLVLVLLIIDGILLGTVVLLQAGQGGGLASLGGGTTDLVMGGRQAVTFLHTASWWTGGIFLVLSLLLSVMAANRSASMTEVQQRLRANTTVAPAPAPLNQQSPAASTTAPATSAAPATQAPAPPPPAASTKPASTK